jgi:hypothetical protein
MEGPFHDPEIPDGEETAYRGLIDGQVVGAGTNRVEHAELDGRPAYRQLLDLTVRGEASYRGEVLFRRSSGLLTSESYRLETAHGDSPVAVEQGWFRGVRTLQWGGVLEPYPRDLAPLLGCAVALRGLDFERGSRRSFALWLTNTVHWEIEARVERREAVELPGGRLPAWRIRVRPHFGQIAGALDRIVQLVLPAFVLHFEADPPHRFLRFEFPTGPFPWNPRGLVEAIELN